MDIIKTLETTLSPAVAGALEEMRAEQGAGFSLEKVNLAELGRRTGISRSRLRRLKRNGFVERPHGRDGLLRAGVSNSAVCFKRLQENGYAGGQTTVKNYIAAHQDLVPAKRHQAAPQGNRGRRYSTEPGEAFQMDWGFAKVLTHSGGEYNAACFAMVCHHCGQRYIEFFPNAKQENLFIGMLHAFNHLGVPKCVLTDNMRSVVVRRDVDGSPVWQQDYEAFMRAVGFQTKLCKPRHPFTKGKVERLIRFVKANFLAGRTFRNLTDLNCAALGWCDEENGKRRADIGAASSSVHFRRCVLLAKPLPKNPALVFYLCPERRISFDGFVNYEGGRFGVPYSYLGKTVRVCRDGDSLHIYSADMKLLVTTHNVTWSRRDSQCGDQYEPQPEEFPTAPVLTTLRQLEDSERRLAFEKFNPQRSHLFDRKGDGDA